MAKLILDSKNLLIDGGPALLQAGTLHYYRLPHRDLWKPVLEQLRVGGFNSVMVSFPWAYHSPAEGFYDFTGPRDLAYLLDAIADAGLWLIAHAGPWIGSSHLGAGGIPGWLLSSPGAIPTQIEDAQRGPSRLYLRHIAAWWHKLFPFFVNRPNHLLTVLHPGRWAIPDSLDRHKLPLVELAAQCGIMTPWAWPALDTGVSRITGELPAEIWSMHDDNHVQPDSVDVHDAPLFVVPQLGYPQSLTGPQDAQTYRLSDKERNPSTLTALLAAGVRAVAIDPGHKGCNWGYWGARGLGTVYGTGAPIDENYGDQREYMHTRRLTMTAETLSQVLLTSTGDAMIYAAPAENLKATLRSDMGSVALLEAGAHASQHLRLSQPFGDELLITDEIHLPAHSSLMIPINLPIAQGMLRTTTLEPLIITEIAGRTLCILRNDEGGDVTLSDDFRPLHIRGAVYHQRVKDGWHVHFDRGRLSTIILDGQEMKLQLLALEPYYADRVWPLDDTWRTTPSYGANWSPTSEDPARGVVIGPDLVVPEKNGAYRYLISDKGFGYRWGPWRGSDPRTWLAPISWQAPARVNVPLLIWEAYPGVMETQPDFSDASWHVVPPEGSLAMEDLDISDGFIWYRGAYKGYAEAVTLQCRHDCDVFLNGQHIAALKTPPDYVETGHKTIPLPGRYQDQNNVLAILVENSGRVQNLDAASERHGLLACAINQNIQIQWRIRGGLLGEQRVQGFYGFADWHLLPSMGDPHITWHRAQFTLNARHGIVQPTYLTLDATPAKVYIYLNGVLVGRSLYSKNSQRRFWLPEGLLELDGDNELLIAQWTRGAEPRLGEARLEAGITREWHMETFGAR